ncbi:hypothetical protein C4D60_Mb07t03790 [Musa balbisiana]|uniref:Uncharacterized protein n=1 Tax=Musa balbisiana TaxID=52838 RepID=A0A4S8JDX9_MUSBA|nr:hypothetical protein C4D60_Mb07t03790 [Musa balbisiana]
MVQGGRSKSTRTGKKPLSDNWGPSGSSASSNHKAEKHGTCSYPIIQDEYSYFSTALGLYFKNNMTEVLNNAGILATNGEKYPLGDVVATIKRAFGASPLLVCKHGSLEELRLCFSKDFKGLLIAVKWRWKHLTHSLWLRGETWDLFLPIIQDEYSYFSTALGLYFKNNMTEVLNNAGILATNGEKYPLGDVVATIKRAFGASPLLVCKHGSLEELRLCFSKDFKPRDCVTGSDILNGMPHSRNSCPRYITLPTYTPLGLADSSKMALEAFDALTVA